MTVNAFVSHTGPVLHYLKRPFAMSSLNLLCSLGSRSGGRGAWDLDEVPSRKYSKQPSRVSPQPAYGSSQRKNQRNMRRKSADQGREVEDERGRFEVVLPDERVADPDWDESQGFRRVRERYSHDSRRYQRQERRDEQSSFRSRGPERRHSPNQDYTRNDEPSVVQTALAAEDDDLLYGVTPVLLALLAGRRTRFETLYVQEGRATRRERDGAGPAKKAENDAAFERILTIASGKQIEIVRLDKGDLNMLSRNRPHQGLVLQTSKLDYEDLKALPQVDAQTVNSRGVPPCYLVLDEVTDPQNAGALMRSAHFLGADGVIACRRNSCRLTPVVSKASAGALEMMRVQGVTSMPRFLKSASENGWRVIGTALTNDAVHAKSVNLDRPTLVVMGSEGHGLRTMVRNACDILVRIEGSRDEDISRNLGLGCDPVDSLNVSVAGALALYQLLGR